MLQLELVNSYSRKDCIRWEIDDGVRTRLTEEGVDGSDASHGMLDARPAGTLTRLTGAGVDCSDASHGMFDARTAGTFTRLTLCSGAIHISDEAPLLKKLSYTGDFPCKSPSFPFLLVGY